MAKETIGRYEIQSEVGRGGMATVYLAYDPNFRRQVAIKVVSSDHHENEIFRQRFEREARLIAKIEHPAIVPVYDYGEYSDDLYLVMRYMPGGTLSGKIKKARLPLREIARIIAQIAPALDAVHAQGIVHRDLKPGNILLDNFGNPAISDFGIAHFTSATTDLTGSAIIGTPAYMSPEQVRGENLDGRSDIYALGVILFEMLSGRGPFQAKTPLGVALQHLTDPIPSIRLVRPDLPPEVDRMLNKALAKERDRRYATTSELALDLQAVADSFHEVEKAVHGPASEDLATEVDPNQTTEAEFQDPDVTEPLAANVQESADFLSSPSASGQPAGSMVQSSPAGRADRLFASASFPIALIGGIFLLFLCGSLGLFGTWAGLRLPGLFAAQNQTPSTASTATPPTASTIQDMVLLADDFSNPKSGWPSGQNTQGRYGYQADGYHILVTGRDQVLWASTDQVYDNVSLSADSTPVIQTASGYYGLLCRIQDQQNFYYFVIQGDGRYTMGKYKNGEFDSFFPEGWRQSDAIQRRNQTNRVQADCDGNVLRLSVNDVLLGEVTDADFSSGLSGMVAAALGEQDYEVRFNSFVVTKTGQ
jgi:serine/threonine protein kinase